MAAFVQQDNRCILQDEARDDTLFSLPPELRVNPPSPARYRRISCRWMWVPYSIVFGCRDDFLNHVAPGFPAQILRTCPKQIDVLATHDAGHQISFCVLYLSSEQEKDTPLLHAESGCKVYHHHCNFPAPEGSTRAARGVFSGNKDETSHTFLSPIGELSLLNC